MNRPTLDRAGLFRRIPLLPQQMRDRVTRTDDAIVLCHLGVPRLDRDRWTLTVDGLVETPVTLRFADLARYPKAVLTSIHQCAGNPLQPLAPSQRICNVTWGGVWVSDILAACRPRSEARYIWSYGADFGTFAGTEIDAYLKDVPLERARADAMVACELNGAPLPAVHGSPARLVVPGFYGTNSVKWLTRMTLADRRAEGLFTTRWYNDPVLDAAGRDTGQTRPVWSIAPQSLIVSPAPDDVIAPSSATEIWGWAWADGGIGTVELSCDGGVSWTDAAVEATRGREWQRFALVWQPQNLGRTTLCARATSLSGAQQPLEIGRNAVHRIDVTVA